MSIKAKLNGIEFTLETEADLRAFLAAARNGTTAPALEGSVVQPETPIRKLRQVCERLKGRPNQWALIRTLARTETGFTDVELRDRLSLSSNNMLGGLVANIAKNVRATGLELERVLVIKPLAASAPAKAQYRLTPDMRDLVPVPKATPLLDG